MVIHGDPPVPPKPPDPNERSYVEPDPSDMQARENQLEISLNELEHKIEKRRQLLASYNERITRSMDRIEAMLIGASHNKEVEEEEEQQQQHKEEEEKEAVKSEEGDELREQILRDTGRLEATLIGISRKLKEDTEEEENKDDDKQEEKVELPTATIAKTWHEKDDTDDNDEEKTEEDKEKEQEDNDNANAALRAATHNIMTSMFEDAEKDNKEEEEAKEEYPMALHSIKAARAHAKQGFHVIRNFRPRPPPSPNIHFLPRPPPAPNIPNSRIPLNTPWRRQD
jgi:hypothetical protein